MSSGLAFRLGCLVALGLAGVFGWCLGYLAGSLAREKPKPPCRHDGGRSTSQPWLAVLTALASGEMSIEEYREHPVHDLPTRITTCLQCGEVLK